MGWANRITIGRGVCTLLVWILLAVGAYRPSPALFLTAFVLFAVAAATDFVDGLVARRLGQESVLGRILDPLVDKFLTIGSMVLLLGIPQARPALPAWMVAVILGRELLVTTIRSGVEARGGNFQAVRIGKYKMAVQCLAVGAVMTTPLSWAWAHAQLPALEGLPAPTGPWSLAHLLAWAALVLTVWSGVSYVARGLRLLATARGRDG